jgi:hypothetical protein
VKGQNISARAVSLSTCTAFAAAAVSLPMGALKRVRDDVHGQVAVELVHGDLAFAHAVQAGGGRLGHQRRIAGDALGREGRHQHAALALPGGPFGDEDGLAHQLGEHFRPAGPADQRVGVVHHDGAHQLGVEDVHAALAEDALGHEITQRPLGGDHREVVAPHGHQDGEAPPAGGVGGQVVPGQ